MQGVNKYRFISIIIIVWSLDLITKIWAVASLSNREVIHVIGDTLVFRLVYNTGGVFGIFQGNPMVFQSLTGFAILFLFVYFIKTPNKIELFNTTIALILGGALGNFTDRFFRPGVVDFIEMGIGIHRWPTYNVADASISVGAVLLAIAFYKMEEDIQNEPLVLPDKKAPKNKYSPKNIMSKIKHQKKTKGSH